MPSRRFLLPLLRVLALAALPAASLATPHSAAHPGSRPAPLPPWLRSYLSAQPEAAAEAGLDLGAGKLDDYSESGRAAQLGALDQALGAARQESPAARLARMRLIRERIFLLEMDPRSRRPGCYLPARALVQSLNLPGFSLEEQLGFAAGCLEQSPSRLHTGIQRAIPVPPSKYMVLEGIRETANCRRVIERIRSLADTMDIAPSLRTRALKAADATLPVVERFGDFLVHDLQPQARGEARPDPAVFARLMREGYGMEDSLGALEARLRRAVNAARREMDSLGAAIDPRAPAEQLVEVLKGSHPGAEDQLSSTIQIFRASEEFAHTRWPGLGVQALNVGALGFGARVEGLTSDYARPRPLRARTDSPYYGIALTDVSYPADVQEAFLRQNCFYFDSVMAARSGTPGESFLWSEHLNDSPELLWAAGTGPFRAWGFFAQHVAARTGQLGSSESRLFEAWTRLIALSTGLEDLRLGRGLIGPSEAPGDVSNMTGVDRRACEDYVERALDSPGREASMALQVAALEDGWERLRSRGVPEQESLLKLSAVALYPPSAQARLLEAGAQPKGKGRVR